MAAKNDPILGLYYGYNVGEDGWDVGMNINLKRLAAVSQIRVKSQTTTTPPVTPAEGDVYFVPTGSTGAWSGNPRDIAFYVESTWEFVTPNTGWLWTVEDDNEKLYRFNGTAPVDAFTLSDEGGAYGLVGTKTGNDIGIKGLSQGTNITITDNGDHLEISSSAGTTFTSLSDTPANYAGSELFVSRVNAGGTGLEFYDLASDIVTDFISLTDTPAGYAGFENYVVRVNGAGTGLHFVAPTGVSISDFTDLGDVPNTYTGQANKIVRVNAGENALEFVSDITDTTINGVTIDALGGGTSFLSDDGTYKAVSGIDPTSAETITGVWAFDTSTSDRFWVGDDNPVSGTPTYFFLVDDDGAGNKFIYNSTNESVSSTSATSYTYSSDDGLNGSSGAVITAGSAVVAASQDGSGSTVAINGDSASINCLTLHPNSEQIDTGILYSFEEYSIEANTVRQAGRANFGGAPFSTDLVMYNGSETNIVRHTSGISTLPVGATPPSFRSTIQYDFDPSTNAGGCRMFLGNEEFVTATLDGTGNETAKMLVNAGSTFVMCYKPSTGSEYVDITSELVDIGFGSTSDTDGFTVAGGSGALIWKENHSTLGDYVVWSVGGTVGDRPNLEMSKATNSDDQVFLGVTSTGLDVFREQLTDDFTAQLKTDNGTIKIFDDGANVDIDLNTAGTGTAKYNGFEIATNNLEVVVHSVATDYILSASDNGKHIIFTHAGAVNLQIDNSIDTGNGDSVGFNCLVETGNAATDISFTGTATKVNFNGHTKVAVGDGAVVTITSAVNNRYNFTGNTV